LLLLLGLLSPSHSNSSLKSQEQQKNTKHPFSSH
jgi:hypothetical protein